MKSTATVAHKRGLFSSILLIIFVFAAFFASPATALAATQLQDGMELEITTDKTEYVAGDKITGYAIVTNTNSNPVERVTLSVDLPEALSFTVDNSSVSSTSLASGGTLRINFETTVTDQTGLLPGTGDEFPPLVVALSILIVGVGVVLFAIKKERATVGTFAVMLLALVLASPTALSAQTAYADPVEQKSFSTSETIKVKSIDYALGATVVYDWPKSPAPLRSFEVTLVDEYGVTTPPASRPALAGGTFVLSEAGNPINQIITTSDGKVSFDSLDAGTYTLEQTLVPVVTDPSHGGDIYHMVHQSYTVVVASNGTSTINDGSGAVSTTGYQVLNYRVSAKPDPSEIRDGADTVEGSGVGGATITIQYQSAAPQSQVVEVVTKAPVIVNQAGDWYLEFKDITSPSLSAASTDDQFIFYQTEEHKRISDSAEIDVIPNM